MKGARGTKRTHPRRVSFRLSGALHRGLHIGLLVGLLITGGVGHLGCNETTKYRVLSFFFDGVPPPGGDSPEPNAPEAGERPEVVEVGVEPTKSKVVSSHAPYEEGLCFNCHSTETSMRTDLLGAQLCRRCHEAHFEPEPTDWSHGPVAAGECRFCHSAHESENQVLLTDPQPDLCLRCHDAALLDEPYHIDAQGEACSACHDPHSAGNRLLLSDSRTYARSKIVAATVRSTHAPWKDRNCSACHVPERANRLVEDIDGVCRSCHPSASLTTPGRELHTPVRQGKCTLCHAPHKSPRSNLVRVSGQDICYTCHEANEISNSNHPRVHSVDCLLCHAGHSSKREHLLKAGIPFVQGTEQTTPKSHEDSVIPGGSRFKLTGGGD